MIITLAEFLAYSPDLDTSIYTSATTSGMLSTAQAQAENYLGYTLERETLTQKLPGYITPDGDVVIHPQKRPINSVVSASIVKGSYLAELTVSNGSQNFYDIPEPQDCIVFDGANLIGTTPSYINFVQLRGRTFYINLTFNAGYDPSNLPEPIKQAIFLYSRDFLSRPTNSSGASRITQGALSIEYTQRAGKSELVADAESLLADYKIVSGF